MSVAYDLGLDPSQWPQDEYSGDSLEEFYDFLMAPRKQQRWSGSGAIKHYGPDRYASINPEDAAMAEILLKQMDAEDEVEFNKGNRASMAARRDAADELMMPSGRGGGTIQPSHGFTRLAGDYGGPHQVGGGMPEGPPPGPPADMNLGQRMLAGGGGFVEPPSESKTDYGTRRPGASEVVTLHQRAKAIEGVQIAAGDLMEIVSGEPAFEGMTPDKIVEFADLSPDHPAVGLIRGKIARYKGAKEMLATITPEAPIEDYVPPGG